MAGRFRIQCINKDPRNDPYTRITHIGGQGRKLDVATVIRNIEGGQEAYYVERPRGDQVDVVVATSRAGNKYIKTTADGDEPNNLLSLPECP
ncbi:DUF3892 domain-containing protein [Mycoplana sp. MJR14]|uniref:DUF3892 domain-containing protein n=1 Tax=Mycoplana sp. MJR14 TaxID=3032583 RepID=UPI000DDB9F6C|nr:DUF3892 domain-containing protein [Mycoplana sp. MJR14]MDF1634422.1 DUF3892 domain-containing protein [Mycoplana sp. MJR14]